MPANDIKLFLPVRDVFITQPFGVNYLDFYVNLGMKGHNGIDFRAKRGCPISAAHDGIILFAGSDGDGGIQVIIWNEENKFKTIYYHLLDFNSKLHKGIKVTAGEFIGSADNTGKYTTGDHLHFGMKFTDDKGNTINSNNGYSGAVDPAPYFANQYGEHWDRPAAYHRYGRRQEWLAEWTMRFKNYWLHRQLLKTNQLYKIYDTEFINALVYGGWDFETVINPAMYEIWSNLKKSEYLDGAKPYC